jgi:hypothetical protein
MHSYDPNCIGNEMRHKYEYSREHSKTMKTQLLLMNKIVEYCQTQIGSMVVAYL